MSNYLIKHTPGPWRIHLEDGLKIGPENAFQPFGGCGCCGSPWMNSHINEYTLEQKSVEAANARLIAAAPDMYTALKYAAIALGPLDGGRHDIARASICAAIAKAEGKE